MTQQSVTAGAIAIMGVNTTPSAVAGGTQQSLRFVALRTIPAGAEINPSLYNLSSNAHKGLKICY